MPVHVQNHTAPRHQAPKKFLGLGVSVRAGAGDSGFMWDCALCISDYTPLIAHQKMLTDF